ncbi:hypothetical protein MHK_001338 [Candidatus Magnetomorum sp. HK-1]|nr:hypothetical protein MHK_001338 [Candidatus Magnetomorum sp. HK-1]
MTLKKIVKDNIVKGIGMILCPYPNYDQLSLNKQKRHNQIKRWISNESKSSNIDRNNNDLHYTYYNPEISASVALKNDWLKIGNALKKAFEIETNKMKI